MSMAGRTQEPRAVTTTTTNTAATITAAAGTFEQADVGRAITAASGIPASTTVLSVQSGAAATLSANATATGSRTATIGSASDGSASVYGFVGWSPETETESGTYTNAAAGGGATGPDRVTSPITRTSQRSRS